MAKAVKRPAESWTYVLVSDQKLPIGEQSRFVLRPMTIDERAAYFDDLARTEHVNGRRTIVMRTHQQALAIALAHIVSVDNFPAGAPQVWPDSPDERRRFLNQLDDEAVREIGNEVWVKSSVGESSEQGARIKNSFLPERTSDSGNDSPPAGLSSMTAEPVNEHPA